MPYTYVKSAAEQDAALLAQLGDVGSEQVVAQINNLALQSNYGSTCYQNDTEFVIASGVAQRINFLFSNGNIYAPIWDDNMTNMLPRFFPVKGVPEGEIVQRYENLVTLSFQVDVTSLSAGATFSAYLVVDDGNQLVPGPEPAWSGPYTQSGDITKLSFNASYTYCPTQASDIWIMVKSHSGTGTVQINGVRLTCLAHKLARGSSPNA